MDIDYMVSKLLYTATNLFAYRALHQSWIVDILDMETAVANVAENFATNLALSSATKPIIRKLDHCIIAGCKAWNFTTLNDPKKLTFKRRPPRSMHIHKRSMQGANNGEKNPICCIQHDHQADRPDRSDRYKVLFGMEVKVAISWHSTRLTFTKCTPVDSMEGLHGITGLALGVQMSLKVYFQASIKFHKFSCQWLR